MQYMTNPMMFDPYASMLGDPYQHDWASQQAQFAQWVDEQERQRQEQESQQNQSSQDFGDQLQEYMSQQAPSAYSQMAGPEAFQIAGAPGSAASTGVSTMSGAPITMTAPGLGSAGTIAGAAPTAATGVTTMTGAPISLSAASAPGMAAPGAFTIGGAGGAGAAGAGAGGAAAGGAGAGSGAAGAGMMAAAPWLAIPAAALGTMQWTNNVEDDVNWGTWFTDPGKGWQAAAENISGKLGIEDTSIGNWLEAPMKLIAPRSLDDIGEGINDTLFLDEIGQGLSDLFSGIF